MRAFLANPKPFLDRAVDLQRYVAERFTVENMTNDIVDFYISELGSRRLLTAVDGRGGNAT